MSLSIYYFSRPRIAGWAMFLYSASTVHSYFWYTLMFIPLILCLPSCPLNANICKHTSILSTYWENFAWLLNAFQKQVSIFVELLQACSSWLGASSSICFSNKLSAPDAPASALWAEYWMQTSFYLFACFLHADESVYLDMGSWWSWSVDISIFSQTSCQVTSISEEELLFLVCSGNSRKTNPVSFGHNYSYLYPAKIAGSV